MGDQLKRSKILKSENGFVLVIAIVILSFLTSTILYLLGQQAQTLKNNKKNYDYEVCIFIAYNGLAKAQGELNENLEYKGTNGFIAEPNGGSYRITISKDQENKKKVEVVSAYGAYKKKFIGIIEIVFNGDKIETIKVIDWMMENDE